MEYLSSLIELKLNRLSRLENLLIEAELFLRISNFLKNYFREQNKDYFLLLKLNQKKENTMLDANFIRYLIQDILLTEEYTLQGIAYYTRIPLDIVIDLSTGCNMSPSLVCSRRILELHRGVRPGLYKYIIQKIKEEF